MGKDQEKLQRKENSVPKQENANAPGQLKSPPGFDLQANPIQGKFWDSLTSMLSPITDWLSNALGGDQEGGDSEKKTGDAPAFAGDKATNGGAPPVVAAQTPVEEKKPETAAPTTEIGDVVDDKTTYYVADPKSAIRKDDDPTKSSGKNLPVGVGVKRVRNSGTVSQVEVTSTNGQSGVSVGSKYWTSTANLAPSEPISDTTLYWVTSTVNATSAPFGKGSTVSMARDTTCFKTERVSYKKGTYVLLKSEDGKTLYGWVEEKHVLKAPKDRAANFDWMEKVSTWNGKADSVDAAELESMKKNRGGVNDRTDDKTYKRNLGAVKGGGYMYSDNSRDIKLEVEGTTEIEKKVNGVIYKELMSEGSWSSMNTYDGEIFTWGRGFAATGALYLVFEELFKINSKYQTMFRQVGLDVVNGKLQVLDDTGKLLSDKSKKDGMDASRYIQKSTQLQSFFIELGEKKDFREDIARAQYRAIMKTAGKWPAYIVDTAKGDFADDWDEAKVAMCAHLGHWLSAGSWDKMDYSDTKGDMLKIQYKYISKMGKIVGTKCEGDTYVWPKGLAMLTKLSHYGNPKGDAKTQFDGKWTVSKDIEVKEVTVGGKKVKRAYLKGESKYLKGVTLVYESGSTYRVVMPMTDMSIDSYIVEDTTATAPAATTK